MTDNIDEALPRRRLLAGAGVVVAAAAVTAACGSSDAPAPEGSGTDASSSSPGDAGSGSAGEVVGALGDVPVGGGVVLKDRKIVLTQPAEGDLRAYTAVCTHQGCLVASVADNVITCPCHNSQFSAEDGGVIQGPAVTGLAPVNVSVSGDQITLA